MKICLQRLFCNLCFMLLGAFSKAEMVNVVSVVEIKNTSKIIEQKVLLKNNRKLLKFYQIVINNEILNEKKKIQKSLIPKKKKRTIKSSNFEVKLLPKGKYSPQFEDDGTILITKKIIMVK